MFLYKLIQPDWKHKQSDTDYAIRWDYKFLLFYFCLYRLNFFFKSRAKGKLFSLLTTSDDTYVVQYSVHDDMEPLFLQRSTDCVSHESPDNLFSFPRVILFVFSMDDSFFTSVQSMPNFRLLLWWEVVQHCIAHSQKTSFNHAVQTHEQAQKVHISHLHSFQSRSEL